MTPLLFFSLIVVTVHSDITDWQHQPHIEIETPFMVVKLHKEASPEDVASVHGYNYVKKLNFGNFHVFEETDATNNSSHVSTHHHVLWHQKQFKRPVYKRIDPFVAPTDPMFAEQWHLHQVDRITSTIPSRNVNYLAKTAPNVNAEEAWRLGFTGKGITMAFVDDGLQKIHPDIQPNFNAEGSWDFNANRPDPRPDPGYKDYHGTCCAGVAGSTRNSLCGVGVAYGGKLSGLRILGDMGGLAPHVEAQALAFKAETVNDVFSSAWGPNDDGVTMASGGMLVRAAIRHGVTAGRNGKGSVYVWSSGNGAARGDHCNADGYANLPYVFAIGAIDAEGNVPYYSEGCAALLAVTPSSGAKGIELITADLIGKDGKVADNCTNRFGGTSAAGPVGVGVVALVLDANSNLTWRDVEGVLIQTAVSEPYRTKLNDWVKNGAGLWHSYRYGFGLLNAGEAVKLALKWKNLPPMQNVTTKVEWVNTKVAANSGSIGKFSFSETDFIVERVELQWKSTGGRRGKTSIIITSPAGTKSEILQERLRDYARMIDFSFGSVRTWGESLSGQWQIEVKNGEKADITIQTSTVKIYGHKKN